jgi:hypothetical protein
MSAAAVEVLPAGATRKSFYERLTIPAPNTFFLLCFAFFLFWKTGWAFWGVDVSDTGWHLHSYQQIFKNPEAVGYSFLYWFSNVIGGTWLALFPNGGLLGVRILGIFVGSATFILSYNLLKNVFNPRAVAVGLLLVSFRLTFVLAHFCYNLFTVFLTVLAISLLVRGLLKNSAIALFFAGVTLAFNIFARLPNIVLLALGGIILLSALLRHENYWETVKKVCFFGSGAIAGILAVFTLMAMLGHLEIFTNAVAAAREVGATAGSRHETRELLKMYLENVLNISLAGVILLFAWLVLSIFKPKDKLLFATANAVFFVFFLFEFRNKFNVNWFAIYGYYALGISVCGGYALVMLRKKLSGKIIAFSEEQAERTLLASAAAAMILLIPVGSDCGILSVRGNFGTLAVPVACALIWDFTRQHQDQKIAAFGKKFCYSIPRLTLMLFVFAFAIVNTKRRSTTFWNDPGSIFIKTSVIDNKHIRHIRTSERMARNINEVLAELHRHIQSGANLMSYDSLPLLSFLTESNSYVKNSWVWVYTPKILEKELHTAETKTKQAPAIVIQKTQFVVFDENKPHDPDYFSSRERGDDHLAKERYFVFKHFMDKHKYERHWGNEFFDVWLPKKGGPL